MFILDLFSLAFAIFMFDICGLPVMYLWTRLWSEPNVTGCGKTLIAVLLIDVLSHLIRKPSLKIVVFLAPNRALVDQVIIMPLYFLLTAVHSVLTIQGTNCINVFEAARITEQYSCYTSIIDLMWINLHVEDTDRSHGPLCR